MALAGAVPRNHPERLENLFRSKAQIIAVEDERTVSELNRFVSGYWAQRR
jgi:hypothetical protein